MAGSRKSSLINTIFKSLALAQPAVINHTGRESPTSRPETGGFFTFTCRARCKIHFKRSSISLIFLGIIIVNTLTHRCSLRGCYIWIRLWSRMFVIKISGTCFQAVSSFRVTNHNLHGLILDGTERSYVPTPFPWSSLSPPQSFHAQYHVNHSGTVPQFSWKSDAVALWLNWLFLLIPQFLKVEKMLRQRKIHLFNCDQLYELSIIENLLNSSKPKLAFDFTVECHYFSLSEMAELSEKVIPALQMDFAFFVVHAHESRLSINDGRGYTKVYRAILQKTGKHFKRDLHTV